jgi:hypothetical protein
VLSAEFAEAADVVVETGQPALMSTRLGLKRGFLVRIPLLLVADEGESLATEGTFFVPSEWPTDLIFLGYSGLLDSIRFAIDPEANDFYFGPSAGRR